MTTPSALSPEQSPEQSRDGSSGPDVEQERAQEPAPGRDEATGPAPAEPAIEERTEAELRTLLGLGPVDHEMVVATRLGNSFVDGLVQVIGALLRLAGLKKGPPRAPRLRRWFTSVVTWIIA